MEFDRVIRIPDESTNTRMGSLKQLRRIMPPTYKIIYWNSINSSRRHFYLKSRF